ncbi:hypothetical protein BRD03_12300 [Halobacteriales archaeon QS_9_68_17]|nr:MAG: hypothetical protein BRD03_12300 [Halobacteriales archaeon QS_9_68_17]
MADELDELFGGGERTDAVLVTAPSRTDLQGLPKRTVAALARPGDGRLVLTTDAASGLRRATATDADRVGAVDRTRTRRTRRRGG